MSALVEQRTVSPKLIDDNSFYQGTFFRAKQLDRAIDGTEDAASVDVGHKECCRPDSQRHPHVGDIAIPEVQLGNASGSFENNWVVALFQAPESGDGLLEQGLFLTFHAEIVFGGQIADGPAVEHHLRGGVVGRFQEDRVHVRVRGDPASLGLNDLRASHLATFGSRVGVERHILCFKGRRMITILLENAAEGRVNDALAGIRTGADEHDRFQVTLFTHDVRY